MSDSTASDLAAEISTLEKQIEAKTAELAQKTTEADEVTKDATELKAKVKELQETSTEATKQSQAAVQEEQEIQPTYERALQNKELRERARICKKEIAALEELIGEKNDERAALALELDSISTAYKEEKALKNKFVAELTAAVDALRAAVDEKIDKTINGEEKCKVQPFSTMDIASDLKVAREKELENNTKLLRELNAVVEMKHQMANKLQEDTDKYLAEKKKEKHDMIKQLVFQFQDQRNILQADIDEVRRVNKDQAINLCRGHVDCGSKDPMLFKLDDDQRSDLAGLDKVQAARRHVTLGSGRHTKFKEEVGPTEEDVQLITENKKVNDELDQLLAQIATESKRKTELAKLLKSTSHRMKIESTSHEMAIKEVESKVILVVAKTKEVESQNNQLSDTVEQLTNMVRTTKKQLERVRGRAAPLPIEDDVEN